MLLLLSLYSHDTFFSLPHLFLLPPRQYFLKPTSYKMELSPGMLNGFSDSNKLVTYLSQNWSQVS